MPRHIGEHGMSAMGRKQPLRTTGEDPKRLTWLSGYRSRKMKYACLFAAMAGSFLWSEASAAELAGPGRFCGYSPIIDLRAGEKVVTLEGGIHGGTFRWEGSFGALDVHGIGWASRPPGRIVTAASEQGPFRFAQRRTKTGYRVALWNGAQGAAYFESPRPISTEQLQAIDRVASFQEGETPSGCNLRTIFSWNTVG
ncbi:hypothetical protein V6R86_12510 [Sphingomonas kaistensis]|uniref:Uncharacterized protein n=1 Tax=Sphingomonas kaistensis TaxID=298708 RepID=A0ABZ2G3B0_9SPHN